MMQASIQTPTGNIGNSLNFYKQLDYPFSKESSKKVGLSYPMERLLQWFKSFFIFLKADLSAGQRGLEGMITDFTPVKSVIIPSKNPIFYVSLATSKMLENLNYSVLTLHIP